jgi:hypothetical protein
MKDWQLVIYTENQVSPNLIYFTIHTRPHVTASVLPNMKLQGIIKQNNKTALI